MTIRHVEADERRPSKQLAARLADGLQLSPEERPAFLQAARGQLVTDRLAAPGTGVRRSVAGAVVPAERATAALPLPSGTVTFLFTNIDGSTQLWSQNAQTMGSAIAMLILGTYRPDEVAVSRSEIAHPLADILSELKRWHGDIWLDLGELAAADGRRFVETYLDTQPIRLGAGFREALFARTGGHALFTVELVRELQERGDIRQNADGQWIDGPAINWNTLPARVEGAIGKRIQRLSLAWDDLYRRDALLDRLLHNAIQLPVDQVALVVDRVEVERQLCHSAYSAFRKAPPELQCAPQPHQQARSPLRFFALSHTTRCSRITVVSKLANELNVAKQRP